MFFPSAAYNFSCLQNDDNCTKEASSEKSIDPTPDVAYRSLIGYN
jgi:hypothetical protein